MLPRLLLVVATITCADATQPQVTRPPVYATRSPTTSGLTRAPNMFRPTTPRPASNPTVASRTTFPTIAKHTRPPASMSPTPAGQPGRTYSPTGVATKRPTMAREQRTIPKEDLPVYFLEASAKVVVQDPTPEVLSPLVDLWCLSFAETINKDSSNLQCHCLQPPAMSRQDPVCEESAEAGDKFTFFAKYFESEPGVGLDIDIDLEAEEMEIAFETASKFQLGATVGVSVESSHQAVNSIKFGQHNVERRAEK